MGLNKRTVLEKKWWYTANSTKHSLEHRSNALPTELYRQYELLDLNLVNIGSGKNITRACAMHVSCFFFYLNPSGHLVPSPILGLANAPIVETEFLELAMSLLDFSPRIPLGTFSI